MLTIYRRHYPPCPHTTRRHRNCKCPIWVQGTLRGETVKQSLDLRSWQAASDLVRGWEASGQLGVVRPDIPTVAEAVEKFLAYQRARHLSVETIRKYQSLLLRRLLSWSRTRGRLQLKQLSLEALREFQQSWYDSPLYATKNLERLRAFFDFCVDAQWMGQNPVRGLKRPTVRHSPTLPFSRQEMKRIVEACDRYPGNRPRLRAFILVMRYSGLRIGDTISLSTERLTDNKLLLYTAKTGTPVYIPLPQEVVTALAILDTNGEGRFFSTGRAKPQTARGVVARFEN